MIIILHFVRNISDRIIIKYQNKNLQSYTLIIMSPKIKSVYFNFILHSICYTYIMYRIIKKWLYFLLKSDNISYSTVKIILTNEDTFKKSQWRPSNGWQKCNLSYAELKSQFCIEMFQWWYRTKTFRSSRRIISRMLRLPRTCVRFPVD